jgi:hypothetical protein
VANLFRGPPDHAPAKFKNKVPKKKKKKLSLRFKRYIKIGTCA